MPAYHAKTHTHGSPIKRGDDPLPRDKEEGKRPLSWTRTGKDVAEVWQPGRERRTVVERELGPSLAQPKTFLKCLVIFPQRLRKKQAQNRCAASVSSVRPGKRAAKRPRAPDEAGSLRERQTAPRPLPLSISGCFIFSREATVKYSNNVIFRSNKTETKIYSAYGSTPTFKTMPVQVYTRSLHYAMVCFIMLKKNVTCGMHPDRSRYFYIPQRSWRKHDPTHVGATNNTQTLR